MVQIDWGGGVYEPCLSVVKLKDKLGVVIIGRQRKYGVHGCDGKRGWLCDRSSYERASSDKKEPEVGSGNVQSDTKVTVGRDYTVLCI